MYAASTTLTETATKYIGREHLKCSEFITLVIEETSPKALEHVPTISPKGCAYPYVSTTGFIWAITNNLSWESLTPHYENLLPNVILTYLEPAGDSAPTAWAQSGRHTLLIHRVLERSEHDEFGYSTIKLEVIDSSAYDEDGISKSHHTVTLNTKRTFIIDDKGMLIGFKWTKGKGHINKKTFMLGRIRA